MEYHSECVTDWLRIWSRMRPSSSLFHLFSFGSSFSLIFILSHRFCTRIRTGSVVVLVMDIPAKTMIIHYRCSYFSFRFGANLECVRVEGPVMVFLLRAKDVSRTDPFPYRFDVNVFRIEFKTCYIS